MIIKPILLSIFFAALPFILSATDFYIATTDLNVREGAGSGYAISYSINKGDEVELLSEENNWYKIMYLGKSGYAHSKFLRYNRTSSDTNSYDSQQTDSNIPTVVYIGLALVIVFILFKKFEEKNFFKINTESKRGTRSERDLISELLKYGIPEQRIFHDLYLKKSNGKFSQIDLVAVTDAGLIVFEVKDYSG